MKRLLVFLLLLLGNAILLYPVFAATATLNGPDVTVCTYSSVMIGPNGNLTITCQGLPAPPSPPPSVPPVTPPATCSDVGAVPGDLGLVNGRVRINGPQVVAFPLPPLPASRNSGTIRVIRDGNTTTAEVTISKCRGVIDPTAGACYSPPIAMQNEIKWSRTPSALCHTPEGQWYLNVRIAGGGVYVVQWALGAF